MVVDMKIHYTAKIILVSFLLFTQVFATNSWGWRKKTKLVPLQRVFITQLPSKLPIDIYNAKTDHPRYRQFRRDYLLYRATKNVLGYDKWSVYDLGNPQEWLYKNHNEVVLLGGLNQEIVLKIYYDSKTIKWVYVSSKNLGYKKTAKGEFISSLFKKAMYKTTYLEGPEPKSFYSSYKIVSLPPRFTENYDKIFGDIQKAKVNRNNVRYWNNLGTSRPAISLQQVRQLNGTEIKKLFTNYTAEGYDHKTKTKIRRHFDKIMFNGYGGKGKVGHVSTKYQKSVAEWRVANNNFCFTWSFVGSRKVERCYIAKIGKNKVSLFNVNSPNTLRIEYKIFKPGWHLPGLKR